MPVKQRAELEAEWEAMSVPERIEALKKRVIRPSLREASERFEKKRREGKLPKVDVVPSFIAAFVGMRDESNSREFSEEERGMSRACMKIIRNSAKQQLSRKDFARFLEGIK